MNKFLKTNKVGEISDYYRQQNIDSEIDEKQKYPIKGKNKSYKYWRNKDGSKIILSSMTKEYLENCIDKIKKDSWREDWLEILEAELAKR